MKQLNLSITNKTEQPNDIITFELSGSEQIEFIPGQFISVELMVNGKPIRRSYSLHNSPFMNEPLAISVKRIDNGIVSPKIMTDATIC